MIRKKSNTTPSLKVLKLAPIAPQETKKKRERERYGERERKKKKCQRKRKERVIERTERGKITEK